MPQTTQKYRVLFPQTSFNVPNTLGAVWKGACGEGFWKQISQKVLGWASGVSSGVTPLSTISCSLSSFGRVKTQWRFSMGRKAYCLCTKLMVVLRVMPLSLFPNDEDANKALSKHRECIGSRYIELFKSTTAEVQQVPILIIFRPLSTTIITCNSLL